MSIEAYGDLVDTVKSSFDLRQYKVSKLTLIAASLDAAKTCLDLVALLRQNKVSKLRLMATSMGSEDTAKSCLDLVALLRQNKVSQLRLMATSMGSEDTAKSCLDLVALLRQNKVSREPRKRRPNALQVPPPRRLSWPSVSDLHSMYKAESWQRAATLDNSTPQ